MTDIFVLSYVLPASVDTVKTRLQGQPSANPPKYNNMIHAYSTILREEGVSRGLYSGVAPAMTGSCTLLSTGLVADCNVTNLWIYWRS